VTSSADEKDHGAGAAGQGSAGKKRATLQAERRWSLGPLRGCPRAQRPRSDARPCSGSGKRRHCGRYGPGCRSRLLLSRMSWGWTTDLKPQLALTQSWHGGKPRRGGRSSSGSMNTHGSIVNPHAVRVNRSPHSWQYRRSTRKRNASFGFVNVQSHHDPSAIERAVSRSTATCTSSMLNCHTLASCVRHILTSARFASSGKSCTVSVNTSRPFSTTGGWSSNSESCLPGQS